MPLGQRGHLSFVACRSAAFFPGATYELLWIVCQLIVEGGLFATFPKLCICLLPERVGNNRRFLRDHFIEQIRQTGKQICVFSYKRQRFEQACGGFQMKRLRLCCLRRLHARYACTHVEEFPPVSGWEIGKFQCLDTERSGLTHLVVCQTSLCQPHQTACQQGAILDPLSYLLYLAIGFHRFFRVRCLKMDVCKQLPYLRALLLVLVQLGGLLAVPHRLRVSPQVLVCPEQSSMDLRECRMWDAFSPVQRRSACSYNRCACAADTG